MRKGERAQKRLLQQFGDDATLPRHSGSGAQRRIIGQQAAARWLLLLTAVRDEQLATPAASYLLAEGEEENKAHPSAVVGA